MKLGLELPHLGLDLRMLVRVWLLQCARYAWGVRSQDDLLEPAREQALLGPLRAQAVEHGQCLGLVHLGDELDGVHCDLLVRPCPRLPPDLEVLEDVLPLLGVELEQSLDPATQSLADAIPLVELVKLAIAVSVGEILVPAPVLDVDVSHLDMLGARHKQDRLFLAWSRSSARIPPMLDTSRLDDSQAKTRVSHENVCISKNMLDFA